MSRMLNVGVMASSLLCALSPSLVACGGGDSAGGSADISETMDEEPGHSGAGGSKAGSAGATGKSAGGSPTAEGGSEDAGEEPLGAAGMPPVDEGDTEAPSVVSTSPVDAASGVKSDASIVIDFSEAMDAASVEAAYQSDDLPAALVAFSWNDEATQLTITPTEKLEYATGKDPAEVLAKGYVITIGAGATDLAANALAEEAIFSFTTLREITANLPADKALSGHVDLGTKATSVTIQAGDTLANKGDRGLITFDLSSVPEVHQLLSAQVVARQGTPTNQPFVDLSVNDSPAKLTLFHTQFAMRAEGGGLLPGKSIGPFSTSSEAGERSLTVTGNVEKDLAGRVAANGLTQYALQFPTLSDGNSDVDKVAFVGATLVLSYYTP